MSPLFLMETLYIAGPDCADWNAPNRTIVDMGPMDWKPLARGPLRLMSAESDHRSWSVDLWRADASRTAWFGATAVLVVVFTILRIVFASTLDLRTDEAYYWTWSQERALSFLDHPPMVAYFVRFGTLLFGDTLFGARFANLVALPLIELLLADVARRRTRDWRAAVFVVLAFEATIYFAQVFVLIVPDAPLITFASVMLWALCRLEETRDPRWWLLAGLAGGLALLSKYTAIFLVPAVFAFVLLTPRNRAWLATPWFWAAGFIAATVFSPVLWWNERHDWISFRFQGTRAVSGRGFSLITVADYFGNNLGLVGPILMPAIIVGAILAARRAYRRSDPVTIALAIAFLVPFVYFACRSFSLKINTSWAFFTWPFGIAATAINLSWLGDGVAARFASRVRRQALAGIAVGILMVCTFFVHGLADTSVWFGNEDPIGGDSGNEQMAVNVFAAARKTGATWIATTDYRTYAALRWHLGKRIPVIQINERVRFIDFRAPEMSEISGHPGLSVFPGRSRPAIWRATSASFTAVGEVQRVWRGFVIDTLSIETVANWTPELSPPAESPLYQVPELSVNLGDARLR
jgi:hypothetical protein